MAETESETFSGQDFRKVLGSFATGVTVVTTRTPGPAYGMTANAFSSVSLDPPLVLVCISAKAEGRSWVEQNDAFAVNILSVEQEEISNFFASPDRPRDSMAFQHIPYTPGPSGSPIFDGVAAYLDCKLHAAHEAGDHLIFIGEVLDLGFNDENEPLLFHGGRYKRLA